MVGVLVRSVIFQLSWASARANQNPCYSYVL
nr:MAG TPA: hypothetical protein [Caudoviricetes sp.]